MMHLLCDFAWKPAPSPPYGTVVSLAFRWIRDLLLAFSVLPRAVSLSRVSKQFRLG